MNYLNAHIKLILRIATICISSTVFFTFVFISCKKEPSIFPDPLIEFIIGSDYISQDTSLLLGDSIIVGINAITQSNDPLTHLHYTIEYDGEIIKVDTAIYLEQLTYSKLIIKGVSNNERWSFYVRDRSGRQSDTISILFTKDSGSTYGSITEFSNLTFGAQNNLLESFFSLNLNQFYSETEAINNQASINLLYFYDFLDGDENTISSPGANIDASVYGSDCILSEWTTKNTTRFIENDNITVEEFDACDNDSLILYNSFEFITGKRKAKHLSANKIFSFVTDSGIKGLFKVISVEGADEGQVIISIKMQN